MKAVRVRGGESFGSLPQALKFHAPLQQDDTDSATRGCRHTNPDICAKNRVPKKFAFVNPEGICYAPSASWPKQFQELSDAK